MSFLQLMDAIFLNQYILEPTRGNNILDLAFSNNEQLIHHYLSTPTVLSHHNILDITPTYSPKQITINQFDENKAPLSKFNYSNADWDKLNQMLSKINLNTALGEECTNKVHNFLTIVEQACRNTLSIKNFKPKSKSIPRKRRILMRKRTRTLKLSTTRVNTTKKLLNTFHDVEIKIQHILTISHKQEEGKAGAAIKDNPKFLYKYAAKYSKTKSNIGPLIDEQGQSVHETKEIADKFRLQYECFQSTRSGEKDPKCI